MKRLYGRHPLGIAERDRPLPISRQARILTTQDVAGATRSRLPQAMTQRGCRVPVVDRTEVRFFVRTDIPLVQTSWLHSYPKRSHGGCRLRLRWPDGSAA